LEDAVPRLRPSAVALFHLASDSLARAWEAEGDLTKALRALEIASRERERAALHGAWGPLYWLQNEARLARLYRSAGRAADAARVEDRLRRLLVEADSNHPILLSLQESEPRKLAKKND